MRWFFLILGWIIAVSLLGAADDLLKVIGAVLAVVLLVKTFSGGKSEKKREVKIESGIRHLILSLLLIVGGGIWLLNGAWFGLVFITCGIILFIYSRKIKNKGMRFRRYIDLIVNQGITSVDDIVSVTNVEHKIVVAELREMLTLSFFPGAYLDEVRNAVIFREDEERKAQEMARSGKNRDSLPQARESVVTCGSCGANNKVVIGKVTECQYCGALIQ